MSNKIKIDSISTKITMAGFLVLGVFIICFITFYFLQNKLMNNDYFFNSYEKYSSLVASESDLFLLTNDQKDLKVVNRLKESFPSIVGYQFFDNHTSLYQNINKNFKWPIDDEVMFKKYNEYNDGIIYENSDYLIYKYFVKIENQSDDELFDEFSDLSEASYEKAGSAYILVSKKIDSVDHQQYLIIIIIFSLFFIITWSLYTQFLKFHVIKPLQKLSTNLDTASKGIYIPARCDQKSSELLNISENFNKLIDQIKTKEKALISAIEDANTKANEKTIFSATLSHEIRTPLNGVIGSLDLIDTTKLEGDNLKYVNTVKESAEHLLNITNSSLDFSKYSLDNVEWHHETANLYNTLFFCKKIHIAKAEEKGIFIDLHYPSNLPLHFEIDETKIKQMVSNLIGNAIKFTERGHILIDVKATSSTRKSCELQISVKDTGTGIASDKLQTIFEPYKQENGNSNREAGGTGLGLSISKRLAILMGGDLTVESELDYGSTFTISLELETSEIISESKTMLNKMPEELKNDYNFVSFIQDKVLGERTSNLFDHYNIKVFKDITALKQETDDFDNVLITDLSISDIDKFKLSHMKIIQVNKDNFDDISLNINFQDSKLSLDNSVLSFLSSNLKVDINDDDYKLISIDNRENLKIEGELSILIAEDNTVNQMVIKKLLSKCDQNNVVIAANGLEALQKVSESHFDVIFMDCQMPIKDGYEATKEIRDMEKRLQMPNIPIIALTANVESADIAKCKEAGMTYFASKPIRQDKVEKSLKFIKTKNTETFVID